MHYTAKYNRGQFSVNHPSLNQVILIQPYGESKTGKKRFDLSKNIETSGHTASYGLPKPSPEKQLTFDQPSEPFHPVASPKPNSPIKQNKEVQVEPITEEKLDFSQEEKLKIQQEIQKKEEEISEIKKKLTSFHLADAEGFNRIDKIQFDKQLETEKRTFSKLSLDHQVRMKNQLKIEEEALKEKEKYERLKDLVAFRNEQIRERQEALKKASQYRQELEVQHDLQKQIHEIEQKIYWENIPRPKEHPPIVQASENEIKKNGLTPPRAFYFTRKQPRHLVFNAITGELKDFSVLDQKSYSNLHFRNQSPSSEDVKKKHIKDVGAYIVTRRYSPN